MTRCSPGDVVLVRFPFTDLAAVKLRPAVIISPSEFTTRHGDVVVMPLTSQPQSDDTLQLAHWAAARLPKPTWVKPVIGTLALSLIARRLGGLAREDEPRITHALRLAIARKFHQGT